MATDQATGDERQKFGAVVGDNVRRLRLERGLSQSEFAGVLTAFGGTWSKSRLVGLELGVRDTVTIDELCQLSGCLRAPLAEFFAGSGEMPLGHSVVEREDLREALQRNDHVRLSLDGPEAVEAFQAVVKEDWAAFELAQQLGISVGQVQRLASRLFGATATEERESRVAAEPDGSDPAYVRRTVTKALTREFQQAIDQEDQA